MNHAYNLQTFSSRFVSGNVLLDRSLHDCELRASIKILLTDCGKKVEFTKARTRKKTSSRIRTYIEQQTPHHALQIIILDVVVVLPRPFIIYPHFYGTIQA